MISLRLAATVGFTLMAAGLAPAHDGTEAHPHFAWSEEERRVVQVAAPVLELAQLQAAKPVAVETEALKPRAGDFEGAVPRPWQVVAFEKFAPRVQVRWDERFVYIEGDGMPEHNMMVGITNWQQHVPLPQPYTEANAWRIPVHPVPAKSPVSIKGRFLRGAIAIAANGVPIFNPQNNRGEISAEIGELDQWGGHCGRADDYHYHAAPLHLQEKLGPDQPIAYALDDYAIYGLKEDDGSEPAGLDAFHGHTSEARGYHYHASNKYPYVQGGFHGEVVERESQVDPQPRGAPIRGALPPLRGAKIVRFEEIKEAKAEAEFGFTPQDRFDPRGKTYKLTYELNGEAATVAYNLRLNGSPLFCFASQAGTSLTSFTRQGGGGEPRGQTGPPAENRKPLLPVASADAGFVLRSPAVANGGMLPVEYSGDGAGVSPPLAWTGAPTATKSYALIMHHVDPQGVTKWYWTLYNIPANVTEVPKNVRDIGTQGSNSVGRQPGYAPPHSKGPGPKSYVLTLYALSEMLAIHQPAVEVTRESLLTSMQGKVLATSKLEVVYSRGESRPAR